MKLIENNIQKIVALCKKYKVGKLFVFGSILTNRFNDNSDVDLVVDFLERLNPEIYVERFVSSSPKEFLFLPQWGLKNFEFTAKVEKRLKERNTYQGILFAGL